MEPGYKYVSIDDKFISKGYTNGSIAYLPQHNYLPRGIKISKLATMLVDELFWDDFTRQEIYQNHHHKTVDQLSGGELRILETLMIIYNKAAFILLDEPFTHYIAGTNGVFETYYKSVCAAKGVLLLQTINIIMF